MNGNSGCMSAILYEREDGRYAVAASAADATFAHGDPKWHRVGPVSVHGLQPLKVALTDCLFHLEVDYGKYHPVCVQARGALETFAGNGADNASPRSDETALAVLPLLPEDREAPMSPPLAGEQP